MCAVGFAAVVDPQIWSSSFFKAALDYALDLRLFGSAWVDYAGVPFWVRNGNLTQALGGNRWLCHYG
jgi:hypothetical protein